LSSSLEHAASTVQRLAVLLSAGVPPTSAWGYLDEPLDLQALTAESPAWRGVAAAWSVATESGAPLAGALRDYARSLRMLSAVEREIASALAGPKATARMVMLLPVIGILFGMLLGFNTLGVLFTTLPGVGCLLVGGALLGAAHFWNRRLIASAQPRDLTPGLRSELVAIAVTGGGSLDAAVASVDVIMQQYSLSCDDDIEAVIALSVRAGVPAAELLRSEAEESRRASAAAATQKASVLAVKLMLPLGVCILPAFMVLGVVPLLMAVISSTVGQF
jgi:tight adherence protein B